MAPPTETLLLAAVEKRLDDRLNSLEKIWEKSIDSLKEVYETKFSNLEDKMDSLQESFSTKEKEARQNKITLWIALIGWIVTTGVGLLSYMAHATETIKP